MQPLKLTIPGRYWDTQLYSGKLYLFDLDGSILTIDWDAAIASWPAQPHARLALVAGFLRSDFLYGAEFIAFFQDPDVRRLVEEKFETLAAENLVLEQPRLRSVQLARQDNRFPFPHADCEIYRKYLFVAGSKGIYRSSCGRGTKLPLSSKVDRHFDAPVFAISASYGTLAAAAGDEGLFEIPVTPMASYGGHNEPRHMFDAPCEDCHWTFHSIFVSSSTAEGALVEYTKTENPDDDRRVDRHFKETVSASQLFGRNGYAWGVQDKICLATDGRIEVLKYAPWMSADPERLHRIGHLTAITPANELVSASSAPFGFVVEYLDSLVVYPSVGVPIPLRGEPVNWRVFPRSRHYENQLHVIYDDRLEILSFNQDYFVSQHDKLSGLEIRVARRRAEPLLRLMGG